ncbi:MAG: 16S rRNA processing protein RimM [Holosporales bacterium]|nr:16S rRNA processing protein RimM [Holosporales bacterium]
MSQSTSRILMGVVHSAHGIRGQVKIKVFAASTTSFMEYDHFTDKEGKKSFIFKDFCLLKEDMIVALLKGIQNRNQAEELKGTELYIAREQLPPTEEEEYYYQDLIGLDVQSQAGDLLGSIASVYNFGGGDLVEINLSNTREVVVLPFTKEAVPKISISEGRLIVNEELLGQLRAHKKSE